MDGSDDSEDSIEIMVTEYPNGDGSETLFTVFRQSENGMHPKAKTRV